MKTFTIDMPHTAPWAVVEANSPREALAAMFADIGQGEEPQAEEYEETWSQGPWVYRVGPDTGAQGPWDCTYFAMPADSVADAA